MTSIVHQAVQEAVQEAVRETARETAQTSKAEILLRLLGQRFGELPGGVAAQVGAAKVDDIDNWIDAVIDAEDLDAVFRNGAMH